MLSPLSTRSLSAALVLVWSAAGASTALAAAKGEAARPHGKEAAPEAACRKAVKAALPNPGSFKWVSATTRNVDKDAYSVVADVEYLALDGAVRVAMVQCDVQRGSGNQLVVPRLRLPQ